MKLTDKQLKFAHEYVIDCNATRAYKAAYPHIKSEAAARACAARLLTNANVRAYIDELLEKIKSEKVAEAQEVMEYLTSVMRREKCEHVVITLTTETSTYVPDEKGTMRKRTEKQEIEKIVEIPARLSDSNKAAELIGKHYAMFADKLTADVSNKIIIDDINPEADNEA